MHSWSSPIRVINIKDGTHRQNIFGRAGRSYGIEPIGVAVTAGPVPLAGFRADKLINMAVVNYIVVCRLSRSAETVIAGGINHQVPRSICSEEPV